MLAFAKGGTGRIELQTRDVSVGNLLRSVLDMIAPQLAERGLILDPVEVDRDFVLRVDEDKARQVLLNVLANALKFTPTGGHITVTTTSAGPVGHIAVRDTGIGVASEQLEAIFEPFVQAGSALQARDSGVGLGLAISRQLARAMSGDLTVVSVLGSGSTFTLELPLRA